MIITAVNSDDNSSSLFIPVLISAKTAENLMDEAIIPVKNGRLSIILPDNQRLS